MMVAAAALVKVANFAKGLKDEHASCRQGAALVPSQRAVRAGAPTIHQGGHMSLRDKIRTNAAHLLQSGEQVQAVIPAQTISAYFALLSTWIVPIANAYRVIVVTDRRVLVCHTGRFRLSPVKSVEHEVARSVQIGPAHGLWYRTDALGRTLYINKRFHKDIAEADAALAGAPAPSPVS
jgi:hypothetical protein